MSISRDRVHFNLDFSACDYATRKAAKKAFGLEIPSYPKYVSPSRTPDHRLIICRPSQFARFLIYREGQGGQNQFKILGAKLVTPDMVKTVDVSANPADHTPLPPAKRAAEDGCNDED